MKWYFWKILSLKTKAKWAETNKKGPNKALVSASFDVADQHYQNVLVQAQQMWKPLPASENLMEMKNSYGAQGIYGAGKRLTHFFKGTKSELWDNNVRR